MWSGSQSTCHLQCTPYTPIAPLHPYTPDGPTLPCHPYTPRRPLVPPISLLAPEYLHSLPDPNTPLHPLTTPNTPLILSKPLMVSKHAPDTAAPSRSLLMPPISLLAPEYLHSLPDPNTPLHPLIAPNTS